MANIVNGFPLASFNQNVLDGVQATLTYAGVQMSISRMLDYVCEPENSFDGVDYLGVNHVIVTVQAVVNPASIASLTALAAPPGFAGDRAGFTLFNLQQVLMQKRMPLVVRLGPDIVLISPANNTFTCDARNGPDPMELRILEVHGVKTAVILFKIQTWVGGGVTPFSSGSGAGNGAFSNIVLSNRWSVRAQDAGDWKTNIITTGRMRLRTDTLANFAPATPDIFRQAVLPLPIPDGFCRDMPDIQVSADGTDLHWQCVDRQRVLNLGSGPIIRLKGQYTNGSQVSIKDMKDFLGRAWHAIIGGTVGAAAGPVGIVTGAVVGWTWNFVPTVQNSFQFRGYGGPNADRGKMLQQLLNFALDRFGPQNVTFLGFGVTNAPVLVSLYATASADDTDLWVELRGEFFGVIKGTHNPAAFDARMNLDDSVTTGQNPLFGQWVGMPGPNPNPPNANSSRGTYIGALLEQALMGNFQLPQNNAQAERGPNAPDIGQNFQ